MFMRIHRLCRHLLTATKLLPTRGAESQFSDSSTHCRYDRVGLRFALRPRIIHVPSIRYRAVALAACLTCPCAVDDRGAPAIAQDKVRIPAGLRETVLRIRVKDAALSDILRQIHVETGRGVFVDGEPVLAASTVELEGPAESVLEAMADRFDYTWEVSKGGSILFLKRFRGSDDIPQLNPLEMRATAEDVVRLISALSPDLRIGVAPALRDLARAILVDHPDGAMIQGRDLPRHQQTLLSKAVMCDVLNEPYVHWLALRSALRWDKPVELAVEIFGLDDPSQNTLNFGVQGPDPIIRSYIICPLVVNWSRANVILTATEASRPAGKQTSGSNRGGPRSGQGNELRASPTLSEALEQPISIDFDQAPMSEIAVELAKQSGANLYVEDALLDHRVSVFESNARLKTVLDAIGELNDWRTETKGESIRIVRRKVPRPRDLNQLAEVLPLVLPEMFAGICAQRAIRTSGIQAAP